MTLTPDAAAMAALERRLDRDEAELVDDLWDDEDAAHDRRRDERMWGL